MGVDARPRALLIGGYGGSWIDGELLGGVALCDEQLATHSARLGAGVLVLLSRQACPVAETARMARWLSDQSAGQCGPCVHGLSAIASGVQELADGVAERGARQRTDRLAALVARRGACGHPDGAVSFILSALEVFATEFADHARHGPCDACARPAELPLPARERAATGIAQVARPTMSQRLRVNPIACEAHGMCAELLPEWIELDDWGYPILRDEPLPPELLGHARRAARACPTLALLIERD